MEIISRRFAAFAAILTFALCVWALAAPARMAVAAGSILGEPRVDYSGENIVKTDGAEITQRVFFSGGKERREQTLAGMTQVVIVRPDKNLVWVIMPQQGMYFEQKMGGHEGQMPFKGDFEVTDKAIGTEKIDGVKTTKRHVTAKKRGEKTGFEGTTWMTDDGILMRMEGTSTAGGMASSFLMSLKNLKIGPQDSTLFELPTGLRRMEVPAAMGSMGSAPPSRGMGGDGTDVGGGGMRKR